MTSIAVDFARWTQWTSSAFCRKLLSARRSWCKRHTSVRIITFISLHVFLFTGAALGVRICGYKMYGCADSSSQLAPQSRSNVTVRGVDWVGVRTVYMRDKIFYLTLSLISSQCTDFRIRELCIGGFSWNHVCYINPRFTYLLIFSE